MLTFLANHLCCVPSWLDAGFIPFPPAPGLPGLSQATRRCPEKDQIGSRLDSVHFLSTPELWECVRDGEPQTQTCISESSRGTRRRGCRGGVGKERMRPGGRQVPQSRLEMIRPDLGSRWGMDVGAIGLTDPLDMEVRRDRSAWRAAASVTWVSSRLSGFLVEMRLCHRLPTFH